jgi:ferritin-like metal-binding protein YciE
MEDNMKKNSLRNLYVDELKDLYKAEHQLVKALPKMANEANSDDLRNGFKEHLTQTKEHASRLEQVLKGLAETVKGKKCKGIEGILAEGGEVIGGEFKGALEDAALISAAQRVEHYEIAAYGSVHAFAMLMGEDEAA